MRSESRETVAVCRSVHASREAARPTVGQPAAVGRQELEINSRYLPALLSVLRGENVTREFEGGLPSARCVRPTGWGRTRLPGLPRDARGQPRTCGASAGAASCRAPHRCSHGLNLREKQQRRGTGAHPESTEDVGELMVRVTRRAISPGLSRSSGSSAQSSASADRSGSTRRSRSRPLSLPADATRPA